MDENNVNTNEFYVLYLKNGDDGSYLESLSTYVLNQTKSPEKAKRFKTPFDAKLFFFDNFKHIQNKFFANLSLKDVSVAKVTVKYNVSFCDECPRAYSNEDDPDSVLFLKKD